MIKLGSQVGFCGGLGLSEAEMYKAMSDVGFQSVDYSLMNGYTSDLWKWSDEDLKKYMTERKNVMNANGIFAGQTHSPMDAYWGKNPETKEARWNAQIQAIKAASYLESPYIVIHPLCPPTRIHKRGYEEAKELNMEYYNFLKPYLEEYNVKAAIENMYGYDPILGRMCETTCSTAKELIDYVDTLNSDRFVVCLDVGHSALGGQDPVSMIYELGNKYLHVTHMHDNNYLGDSHMMAGMGKLDWWSIGKALNDIGFEDVFNYEADCPYGHLGNYRKILSLDLLKVYAEVGKAIISVK
jgi:sugar phosphate isomerase/epimerase